MSTDYRAIPGLLYEFQMRLHALQYLRAIAAIAVVWSHAVIQRDEYRQYLAETGAWGVDVFFVISGFIMVFISKPTDTPKKFLVNRISRVVPLYWFFTLLTAVILLAMPNLFNNSEFSWIATIKSFLFIPEVSITKSNDLWPILAPGWSLNYEMFFYVVFALSLFAPVKYRVWACCTAIVALMVLAGVFDNGGPITQFYSQPIVLEFILGMLLAIAFKRDLLRVSQPVAWFLIVAGFVLLIFLPSPREFVILSHGIPALIIVTGTLYCKMGESRFFVMLGDSSYSLYLCHIFTLGGCRLILVPMLGEGRMAAILFAILSTLICIASGVVVHYMIDNWLLKKERFADLSRLAKGRKASVAGN